MIAPLDTAALILDTIVASGGGWGAVTVMIYLTLIFDACKLIPHCPSSSPRPNDDARAVNDNDDDEATLSTLLLL